MLSRKRLLDYIARQALCKLFKVFCFPSPRIGVIEFDNVRNFME